jgi:hypothetical protein
MFNALSVDDERRNNDQAERNHGGQNACTLNDTTYVISPLSLSSVVIPVQCTLRIKALPSTRIFNTEVIAQPCKWYQAKVTVPETSLRNSAESHIAFKKSAAEFSGHEPKTNTPTAEINISFTRSYKFGVKHFLINFSNEIYYCICRCLSGVSRYSLYWPLGPLYK